MKKSRSTEEQIIGFLKEAEAGSPVAVFAIAIIFFRLSLALFHRSQASG